MGFGFWVLGTLSNGTPDNCLPLVETLPGVVLNRWRGLMYTVKKEPI